VSFALISSVLLPFVLSVVISVAGSVESSEFESSLLVSVVPVFKLFSLASVEPEVESPDAFNELGVDDSDEVGLATAPVSVLLS